MKNFSFKSRFLVSILLIALVPLTVFSWINLNDTKYMLESFEENNIDNYFNEVKENIDKFFIRSENSIRFLKDVSERELSYTSGEQQLVFIRNIILDFAKNNEEYSQIRMLDKRGNEVIRVENYNDTPILIGDSNLQNKADRYYFVESLNLKENEIYKSKIDLNVENHEIEVPYKAVMRYSIPVVMDDEIKYYLIINLDLNRLIEYLAKNAEENSYNKTFIFREEGDYILHYNKDKEWGSARDLSTGEGFLKDYEELYKIKDNSDNTLFEGVGQTTLALKKVYIEALDNRSYYIGLEIDNQVLFESIDNFKKRFLVQVIIFIVIVFAAGILFTSFITKPIYIIMNAINEIAKGNFNVAFEVGNNSEMQELAYEIKKMSYELESMYRDMEKRVRQRTSELEEANKAMKAMAETDPLTGLYNRHFFNKYSLTLEKGNFSNIIIIIIDVNDFKYINDHYGHNIGDEVLIQISKILRKAERDTDFVVRYGGDEFLVVLYNCDEEVAKSYINRVNKLIDDFNKESKLIDHNLDISFGYESYDGSGHILEAINSADEKMYKNKVEIKKRRGDLYGRK